MKVQLETITKNKNRSFSLMFNPRLNDLFYWHIHPEYELVFIEAKEGNRHVGNHLSKYHDSDLVLIGSNIPHLNFDCGVQTDYRKAVVHLKKDLVEQHFANTPELAAISRLFFNSNKGIAFKGLIKNDIGQALFLLNGLSETQQYIRLIEIFEKLSRSTEFEYLHHYEFESAANNKNQKRLNSIYSFIDHNYQRKISLEEMAQMSFMTKEAFCRYFKKKTTYTFTEFLNRFRISHAKRELMTASSVSEVCYNVGFESLSYFNRVFKSITNESPRAFKKKVQLSPANTNTALLKKV